MTEQLTQARLKELLDYDPETGVFTWRVANGSRAAAGQIAGRVSQAGYVQIGVDGKRYSAHRLAFLYMTGAFPEFHTDHINRVRCDNRWGNLRTATPRQNIQNKSIGKNNKSGAKGVSFDSCMNKWRARININGQNTRLGVFNSFHDAAEAYADAAKKHFGDFAAPIVRT